ncbi:substrate-binding domain-containing protein, partial [Halorubrum sp. SD612]|uniref:substrate-binding domain-containing protein n=1 Tax=Halorubrum sp. SD612 TaxID=1855863 RepID=UPI000A2EB37E
GLGGCTREWRRAVPSDNPAVIEGRADLAARDLRLRNRRTVSGLRRGLDAALDDLAGERDADRRALAERIDGYERTAKGFESPVRAVAAGDADAGLGLRETAERLGCGFVSLGEQSVAVRAAPERVDREPVAALAAELGGNDEGEVALDAILADLPGYSRNSRNDP